MPALDGFELRTIDSRFHLRGERMPESDDIVILGVDDKTREEAPEVFQTRRGWAKLIDKASAYEPLALGFDFFYASPEVTLSRKVVKQVRLISTRRKRVRRRGRTVPRLRSDHGDHDTGQAPGDSHGSSHDDGH